MTFFQFFKDTFSIIMLIFKEKVMFYYLTTKLKPHNIKIKLLIVLVGDLSPSFSTALAMLCPVSFVQCFVQSFAQSFAQSSLTLYCPVEIGQRLL